MLGADSQVWTPFHHPIGRQPLSPHAPTQGPITASISRKPVFRLPRIYQLVPSAHRRVMTASVLQQLSHQARFGEFTGSAFFCLTFCKVAPRPRSPIETEPTAAKLSWAGCRRRSETPHSALESVQEVYQGLQSFRNMSRMDASRRKANALRLRFSKSLAKRRQRFSQAIVRSTIQRFGRTTNPLA
jgi:hypothetical protein